jgi:hypothetical protein
MVEVPPKITKIKSLGETMLDSSACVPVQEHSSGGKEGGSPARQPSRLTRSCLGAPPPVHRLHECLPAQFQWEHRQQVPAGTCAVVNPCSCTAVQLKGSWPSKRRRWWTRPHRPLDSCRHMTLRCVMYEPCITGCCPRSARPGLLEPVSLSAWPPVACRPLVFWTDDACTLPFRERAQGAQ